ncbi:MAG: hypothetical protein ABSD72_18025 [Terracidiphilus sp.]|jgi:hypothetical protein
MWIYIGAAVGLAAPILLGFIYWLAERKQDVVLSPREWKINPDWPKSGQRYLVGSELVDFVPRMQQYTKTTEIMITISSASIVFIPSHVSKQPMLAFSFILLGFAVLWGVFFIAWMSYCYEESLYNPANFNAITSSVMFGLGFGALASFVGAYAFLAVAVAKAITYGQPLVQ